MDDQVVFAAVAVLFIGLAVPLALRRIRPNRWYGLRTPATLADEWVWYEANAISGRDLIALGCLLLGLVLVLPYWLHTSDRRYSAVCVAVGLLGTLAIAARGWRKANQLLQERRAKDPGSAG